MTLRCQGNSSTLRCATSFTALRLLALAVLLIPAAEIAAQVPRDSTARDTTRDTTAQVVERVVVTGARTPAAVGGAGAVVVRPDSLPVPTAPAPSLEQVLRQVPFVLVRQNARGEIELSVRGSESRQAAVLLDGLPLTLGWDHRADPSLVPTTGVRALTLVRGLSTLLAGPNVLGGVITLGLAQPVAGAGGDAPGPELSLGTSLDQYGARVLTAAGGVPVAAGAGTLTLRAGASYREREGFALSRDVARGGPGVVDPGRDNEGDLRTNSDLRQVDGFAALRFESPAGRHIGLTATGYQARRGVPPELHVEDPRLWRYPDVSRRLAILSAGTGDVTTPLGRARLDVSAGVNDGEVEIESFESRAYQAVVGRELGDERAVTGRVVGAHSLIGGGELRAAYTVADVRYDETLDDEAPSRYRQRLSSAAAEVQWPVLSRALIGGGLVYDVAETPETGGKPALGERSQWGWRAGATAMAFDQAVQLHASVSRRARFPALRELYSGALNRFEPNPSLRPERLLGVELGATMVEGAATPAGLALQAVAFHHRLKDAVVRVSTPEDLFRRVNRDEIRSTGFELLAGWTPPAAGEPTSWLAGVSLTGDLMVQRVRVYDRTLGAGEPNERRPEHQPEVRGALELGVPMPLAVRGIAGVRYTGRQFCVHPDLERQVELGGQTVGDLAVTRSWPVAGTRGGLFRALRATLALENVTDATIYDQCGLPQPGRTLRVGLELH